MGYSREGQRKTGALKKLCPGRMQSRGGSGAYPYSVSGERSLVKDFLYTPAILAALEDTVSTERLSPYREATGDDAAAALRLYTWNATISAALYVPLQGKGKMLSV